MNDTGNIPPMGIRILFLLFLLPLSLQARPISYSGGSTFMVFSDEMSDAAYYHYSPSYKYSLGIELVDEKNAMKNHA
ncbi:MAG: hypothetical protein ACPG2A_08050, partial [Parvibaculales bacterium]